MKKQYSIFIIFLLSFSLVWAVTHVQATRSHAVETSIIYSSYLGADAVEEGFGVAVDSAGNAHVTGFTQSTSFPTQTLQNGQHGIDVILAKFAPDGTTAEYIHWVNALSLFAPDYAYSVAIDGNGGTYITGDTQSNDFCAYFGTGIPGYDTSYNGNTDAFVIKVDSQGAIVYCTFLGGNDSDIARAIDVDSAGNVVVTGGTWSTDFPTTNGVVDESHNGARDIFVTKLDTTGTVLSFSTFIGGSGQEESKEILLSSAGNSYVTGWTNSDTDFPTTTGAYDTSYNGNFDAFLFQVSSDGTTLAYSSYVGGTGEDRALDIGLAENGSVMMVGQTTSTDFPTSSNAYDESYNGLIDLFVAGISADGASLTYGSYVGGTDEDIGNGLAFDTAGNIILTGETHSADFPITTDAYDNTLSGNSDAFLFRLQPDGSGVNYSTFFGGTDDDRGAGLAVGIDGDLFLVGSTRSTDFPITAGAFDESHNGDYDLFVSRLRLATPMTVLTLDGATTGVTNASLSFTATVSPINASVPILYEWQATEQTPFTQTNGTVDTTTFVWTTAGTKAITVTAKNAGTTILTQTHIIQLSNVVVAKFYCHTNQWLPALERAVQQLVRWGFFK